MCLIQRHELIEAKELINKTLKKFPNNLLLLYSLARTFTDQVRFSKAIQVFIIILKDEPDNPIILYYVGLLYFVTKKYRKSEIFLKRALKQKSLKKIGSKKVKSFKIIVQCLLSKNLKKQGRKREAKKVYRKVSSTKKVEKGLFTSENFSNYLVHLNNFITLDLLFKVLKSRSRVDFPSLLILTTNSDYT